ncbi:MAG: sigma-70 family RNA polymerase sigma factor [Anaerolineales bacterium]|nr:sigma-70 family RNA polymerase sigma factor [Anaerolineales bacterium]
MNKKNFWLDNFLTRQMPARLDAEAFAELYRAHTYAVFNYCLFRVSDRVVAEDLTADTFERAWRARGRYRPDRSAFTTWVFSIARHAVTDWQRRRARRPLSKLNPEQPSETLLLEAQFEESEQQTRLRRLVQTLAADEQELIALKFGAGMTNRHIAEVLGKSESAVGSAVYRIMQKLREQWGQSE